MVGSEEGNDEDAETADAVARPTPAATSQSVLTQTRVYPKGRFGDSAQKIARKCDGYLLQLTSDKWTSDLHDQKLRALFRLASANVND